MYAPSQVNLINLRFGFNTLQFSLQMVFPHFQTGTVPESHYLKSANFASDRLSPFL